MEEEQRQQRCSGPPRIPTKLRISAVETLAKSKKAAGSYRLRRAARRSASFDSLVKQEPPSPPSSKKVLSPQPDPKEAVSKTLEGRGESGGDVVQPSHSDVPSQTAASPPRPPEVRRCVSTGDMPTDIGVDPLSACSALISTALRLGNLQRGKEAETSVQQQERGRSPRGGSRSPVPSLTRRVSASSSPISHGGGGGGGGGEGVALKRRVRTDGHESSSSSSSNKLGGESRSLYEYWSYYNSRPASIVRGATSEMADDILSSAADASITAPISSTTTTAPTTPASAPIARAQPTTAKETTTEAGESAAVDESRRVRAVGQAARAARAVALAEERWAKAAKFRLQEMRKHSGNR